EEPVPRLPWCEAHRCAPFVYAALHRPSDLWRLRRAMHLGHPQPLPVAEATPHTRWPQRGVAGRLAAGCGIRRALGTASRRLYLEGCGKSFTFYSLSIHFLFTFYSRVVHGEMLMPL